MFHQLGYLVFCKLNNAFRKLHEKDFCYKIQLEHISTELSKLT